MYLHHSCDAVNTTGMNDLEIIFPMLATYPADLIRPDSIALIMPSDGASDDVNFHNNIEHPSTIFLLTWRNSPQWARASLFTRFLDHTQ